VIGARAAVARGALVVVVLTAALASTWATPAHSSTPVTNRLAVKTVRSPYPRLGFALHARYTIAPPPACKDRGRAAFDPICTAYNQQRARLVLEVRFHGVLVLDRQVVRRGRLVNGRGFGTWNTFVDDLDLQPLQCHLHATYVWTVFLVDPYARADRSVSGRYTITECAGE
jgi:hypothetical protein